MLKTRATAKSAAAFLFALILAPAAIHAQKPPTPVVAVVDYQVILRDSTAIKSVRDQAEEERQKLQASATDQEKKLRASTENLEKQRAVLSPEAFAQKQRELQTELAEFRRQFQLRRRQLDQAFAEADQKFQDTLVVIVEEQTFRRLSRGLRLRRDR